MLQLTVSRNEFAAALKELPADLRARFLERLHGLASASPSAAVTQAEAGEAAETPTSYPLTIEQARDLTSKIDSAMVDVLKAAVSNLVNGVAVIKFSDVKACTGVDSWPKFARGYLAGLHRSLRTIVGDRDAKLLFWDDYDNSWLKNEFDDWIEGNLMIDGPVVDTLRGLFGLN